MNSCEVRPLNFLTKVTCTKGFDFDKHLLNNRRKIDVVMTSLCQHTIKSFSLNMIINITKYSLNKLYCLTAFLGLG